MLVLSSAPGRIVALPEIPGFPLRLTIEGLGGFNEMQAVVTSLGYNEACNVQFMHTLRNYIYVYSFGDRIADLVIGGIAATTGACGIDTDADAEFNEPGIERVLRYWRTYRLSHSGRPVRVTMGLRTTFNAFLISKGTTFQDVGNGLAQFSFNLKYPIERGLEIVAPAAGAAVGGGTVLVAGDVGGSESAPEPVYSASLISDPLNFLVEASPVSFSA